MTIVAAEILCIIASMTLLITGYYQSNLFPVAVGCFGVGLLWLLSQRRRWDWVASTGLFVFITAAGIGILIGLKPIMMALSLLGSLAAWDLAGFSRRLREAAPEDDLRRIEKDHLVRLASLVAIGLFLILAALIIQIKFAFEWMFLLTCAALLGLVQLVNRLRRGG